MVARARPRKRLARTDSPHAGAPRQPGALPGQLGPHEARGSLALTSRTWVLQPEPTSWTSSEPLRPFWPPKRAPGAPSSSPGPCDASSSVSCDDRSCPLANALLGPNLSYSSTLEASESARAPPRNAARCAHQCRLPPESARGGRDRPAPEAAYRGVRLACDMRTRATHTPPHARPRHVRLSGGGATHHDATTIVMVRCCPSQRIGAVSSLKKRPRARALCRAPRVCNGYSPSQCRTLPAQRCAIHA